ncbi:MAG TPA: hypothetical protein EYP14_04485, partial [Planctomycetaceae bacterium]|nr:hypothetical protein [Planctomycetaceae bacterium]
MPDLTTELIARLVALERRVAELERVESGYAYVPKQPPGYSSDWDGDSKATGVYTVYASDFSAPNTAKALKVRLVAKFPAAGDGVYLGVLDMNDDYYGGPRSLVSNRYNEMVTTV